LDTAAGHHDLPLSLERLPLHPHRALRLRVYENVSTSPGEPERCAELGADSGIAYHPDRGFSGRRGGCCYLKAGIEYRAEK
jgi:hypothetical protein